MSNKHLAWALGIILLGGCTYPVREQVDGVICARPLVPIDTSDYLVTLPAREPMSGTDSSNPKMPAGNGTQPEMLPQPQSDPEIKQTAAQDYLIMPPTPRPTLEQVLTVPKNIPGAEAPIIVLPKKERKAALEEVVKEYFKPLPPLGPEPKPAPGPQGRPLTLADLQRIAQTNSPQLREAAAAVEAARGAAIQAGLYPNPTWGITGSMPLPSSPGSTVGTNISQTIPVAGKLKLAQAAAMVDLKTTQLAYRRAATDLMYNVRTSYFAVLVALEEVGENRAVAELTDTLYNVWVRQLKGGEVATYEPMQGGVFAIQARAALVSARNAYTLAWRQLASAIGLPAMPPTEIAGDIEKMPLPIYRYDTVLAHVLANHTDMLTAQAGIDKARYNLRLAQVQVFPDPTATMGGNYDNTQPGPYRFGGTLGISVAIPVWNFYQGAIYQAQGMLIQAIEEPHRVRDTLTASVADAFRRYDENRVLLKLFREEALPKQVQAFRAAVKRHYAVGPAEAAPVAFTDLVSAEQNLVSVVATYSTYLAAQWLAVADVANFLQTNDIFQVAEKLEPPSEVDLRKLLELPDCHPCSPMPDPALRGADINWPYSGWDRPDTAPPPSLQGKDQTRTSRSEAPGGIPAGWAEWVAFHSRPGEPLGAVPAAVCQGNQTVPVVTAEEPQNRHAGP